HAESVQEYPPDENDDDALPPAAFLSDDSYQVLWRCQAHQSGNEVSTDQRHRLVTTVSQQPSSIRGHLRRDVVDNRVADAVRAGGISAFHRAECDRNRAERLSGLDRKSTRLNYSHVSISYAVF